MLRPGGLMVKKEKSAEPVEPNATVPPAKGEAELAPATPETTPPVILVTGKPETTAALDDEIILKTAGQRKINLIWEVTQSLIAIMSVGAGIFILIFQAMGGQEQRDLPTTLSSMIFLVLGFYFARTNHEKVGGVGARPEQKR